MVHFDHYTAESIIFFFLFFLHLSRCTAAPGSSFGVLVSADSSKKTHQGSLTRCWTPKHLLCLKTKKKKKTESYSLLLASQLKNIFYR